MGAQTFAYNCTSKLRKSSQGLEDIKEITSMDAYVHGFLYSVHPDGPSANSLILLHESLL